VPSWAVHCRHTAGVVALLLLVWAGCTTAPDRRAELNQPPQAYLRKAEGADGGVALDTGLRAFVPERGRGPVVWLVGVAHLGTTNYYAELQRFLDAQSLVLFEGVGATNRQFQLRQDSSYSLQESLAKALGLEFQLDAIDYSRAHFRNSDLSLSQIEQLFASKASEGTATGQSVGRSEFDQLVQLMQGSGFFGGLARFGVAFIAASPKLQATAKLAMIEVTSQVEGDLLQMAGLPPGWQRLLRVLIEERNKLVVRDLQAALRERPRARSVAVLYGAGHMTDLELRLRTTLHYRPNGARWLTAFAVNPHDAGLTDQELEMTRRMIHDQLEALQSPLEK
jgi:hypothetical protein